MRGRSVRCISVPVPAADTCLRRFGVHSWTAATAVSRGGCILDLHLVDGYASSAVLFLQLGAARHRRVAVREGRGVGRFLVCEEAVR